MKMLNFKKFYKYEGLYWIPLCTIAGFVSVSLGQDDCGDLRNYHYYNAFALFHHARAKDIDVPGLQGFLNPILDLPYYALTVLFPKAPRIVAFFMGLPFGVIAYFSSKIAWKLFSNEPVGWCAALIAVGFGLSGSASFSQLGLSTNEVPTAALVIAGLYNLIRAIELRESGFSREILSAGLLVGLAVGAKLTAGPYAMALTAATLSGFELKYLPSTILAVALSGFAGVLITGGPWMLHLYLTYGNPIFPYHNEFFHSPWAAPYAYVDDRFFPNPGVQNLLYPFWWVQENMGLVTEYPFEDPRIASIFIVSLLCMIGYIARFSRRMRSIPREWIAVIAFWIVAYIAWLQAFSIYRYAVPIEIVGGYLYAGGIRYIFRQEWRFATAVMVIGFGIIAGFTIYPDWGHISFQSRTVPVTRPMIAADTLVITSDYYPSAYLAAFAPKSVEFVNGSFNFIVPEGSPLDDMISTRIKDWSGPIDLLGSKTKNEQTIDAIKSKYNVQSTNNCEIVQSHWDDNALELCEAYRQRAGADFQTAIALSFEKGSAGTGVLGSGWATPESWGTWSVGLDSDLLIPSNPLNKNPLLLTLTCRGFSPAGEAPRRIEVFSNNDLIGRWTLTQDPADYEARIPPTPGQSDIRLRFRVLNPISPSNVHISNDKRTLGIGIQKMIIQDTSN